MGPIVIVARFSFERPGEAQLGSLRLL